MFRSPPARLARFSNQALFMLTSFRFGEISPSSGCTLSGKFVSEDLLLTDNPKDLSEIRHFS